MPRIKLRGINDQGIDRWLLRSPEKQLEWRWNQDTDMERLGSDLEAVIYGRQNQRPGGLREQVRERFDGHYSMQRSKKLVNKINSADQAQ